MDLSLIATYITDNAVSNFISANSGTLFTGGTAGLILWVLKKVPNQEIKNIVSTFFYGIGRTVTLGMANWKFTKSVWNSTIEPWLIDLIDNTAGGAIEGFIKGLRVDNKQWRYNMLKLLIGRLVKKHGLKKLILIVGDFAVKTTKTKKDDEIWNKVKKFLSKV